MLEQLLKLAELLKSEGAVEEAELLKLYAEQNLPKEDIDYIKSLAELADDLDNKGLMDEADKIDSLMKKLAVLPKLTMTPAKPVKELKHKPEPKSEWKQTLEKNPQVEESLRTMKQYNLNRITLLNQLEQLSEKLKEYGYKVILEPLTEQIPPTEQVQVPSETEPELSPEEEDMLKLMGAKEENLKKVFGTLSEIADKLDDSGLVEGANMIDEFLHKHAEILPPIVKPKDEGDTDQSKRYDSDFHHSLQVKEPQKEQERVDFEGRYDEHHIKTYRDNGNRTLSTRYCPDHIGSSLVRSGENQWTCLLDNKVYNWEAGFKLMDGTQISGGSVAGQTPLGSDYVAPHRIFDNRPKK